MSVSSLTLHSTLDALPKHIERVQGDRRVPSLGPLHTACSRLRSTLPKHPLALSTPVMERLILTIVQGTHDLLRHLASDQHDPSHDPIALVEPLTRNLDMARDLLPRMDALVRECRSLQDKAIEGNNKLRLIASPILPIYPSAAPGSPPSRSSTFPRNHSPSGLSWVEVAPLRNGSPLNPATADDHSEPESIFSRAYSLLSSTIPGISASSPSSSPAQAVSPSSSARRSFPPALPSATTPSFSGATLAAISAPTPTPTPTPTAFDPKTPDAAGSIVRKRYVLRDAPLPSTSSWAWRAKDIKTNIEVIVRFHSQWMRYDAEIHALRSLKGSSHTIPSIISFSSRDKDGGQGPDWDIVITEQYSCALSEYVADSGLAALEPTIKRNIITDITHALVTCHAHGIIHGNLCPENIHLLPSLHTPSPSSARLQWQLSGFDSSRNLDQPPATDISVDAMSPEVARIVLAASSPPVAGADLTDLQDSMGSPVTTAIDIFALGRLIMQLALGRVEWPAHIRNSGDRVTHLATAPAVILPSSMLHAYFTPSLYRDIECMLSVTPSSRPSLYSIQQGPLLEATFRLHPPPSPPSFDTLPLYTLASTAVDATPPSPPPPST